MWLFKFEGNRKRTDLIAATCKYLRRLRSLVGLGIADLINILREADYNTYYSKEYSNFYRVLL